jgi:tetratricopeptide (TPR) repeat protein
MGGLILCQTIPVRHPYYVPELGLHLYTGEELSYYLYNHALLLPEDFPDDSLFPFLEELGQGALAERLRRYRGQTPQSEALVLILQELKYYSGSELFAFRKQMETLALQPEHEREKSRADELFRRGRYYGALHAYEELLGKGSELKADSSFIGKIWHNRGSVLARMQNYREARESYRKAYSFLVDEVILEELWVLSRLSPEAPFPEDLKGLTTPAQEEKFERHFRDREQQAIFEGKGLEAMTLKDAPASAIREEAEKLLESWKDEYRRNQV